MDGRSPVPVSEQQDLEFDQAFELLSGFVDLRHADELQPLSPQAIYTSSVVLWLLISQRLQPRSTLETVVKSLREIAPQLCPDNRRIREGTLSESTAAYSQARHRLKDETVEWLAHSVSHSICAAAPPTLGNRRVFLVDGTTLTLAPARSLRAAFPPASNQYGDSAWPVAHLVVTHELESGCAQVPEVGAKYGPHAVAEVELARACFQRLPPDSVILADAGFGIYSVAWAAVGSGHAVLLRLSPQRFQSLVKQSAVVAQGEGWATWSCRWKPTAKDRKTNPHIPATAVLPVRLHALTALTGELLYFVTTLPDDVNVLGSIYQKRMDVETDIRNIKVVLDREHIQARSPAMFRKELLTSMVAYNLVVQFRRQAAALAKVPPRRLSFTSVWNTFRIMLLLKWSQSAPEWRERYRRALEMAMRDKLPNRPGRSFPREAYRRTSKATHFQKRSPPETHPPNSK